jgi:hypothetical protein
MAKRRVRNQIVSLTPDHKKLGIDPIYLAAKNLQHTWKALDKGYNFASDGTSIQGLLAKLRGSKVAGVLVGAILKLPLESPERKKSFGCGPHGEV